MAKYIFAKRQNICRAAPGVISDRDCVEVRCCNIGCWPTLLPCRSNAQGGDVAEAYVIAHEVGHHVQNQLGIMSEVQRQGNSNDTSIKLELQADCFAGVWAYSIRDNGVLAAGEINEAIDAAAAVGDDRIQQSVQGQISPETWTHGSSEQRVEWFTKGYNAGSPNACNTF